MKKQTIYIIIGLGALLLITMRSYKTILGSFLAQWEGFSATPYWDVNRYSWGYGTPAPGATGTITRAQALIDAMQHIAADRNYLLPMINRKLNAWQWAALLSFSYNLGAGNADNLIDNINSGDDQALRTQWLKYNKADGIYNSDLAARRQAEFDQLWQHA